MNQSKFKKGFGILEVLVASVIIITILAALVFIGRAALANSLYTQQRAQAIFLAQEGIELTRQMRDTNWIDNSSATQWNFLDWNVDKSGFNPVSNRDSIISYSSSGSSLYRYGLSPVEVDTSGEPVNIDSFGSTVAGTDFTRKITVADVGNLLPTDGTSATDVQKAATSLKITCDVMWHYNGSEKHITVSEILTNWRPNY